MPSDTPASVTYPPLTPKMDKWMKQVLANRNLLGTLFELYGSPINLHHMGPFAANYAAYKEVFERYGLQSTVFFARKANKCRAFVKEADQLGFGVDTASYRELKQCLDAECEPQRLVLTAAIKTERLLRLALTNDVLMVLDNRDECELVNRLAGEVGKTPKVGIRISGFRYKGEKLYSRFGFDIEEAVDFITHRLGPEQEFYNLRFAGFHFHLDGYSRSQRAAALLQTVSCVDELQNEGIPTSFIDMGGGLLTNYLEHKEEWGIFWEALKKAVQGQGHPVTFGNNGLGYRMEEEKLQGAPDVYPYYNKCSKEQFLDDVLRTKGKDGQTVAQKLRTRDIELRIEPGRSLLDQTGMTLAKVVHCKKDQRGEWLVGLEMNRSQLFSSSADFLVDPEYISMKEEALGTGSVSVYFTGGYCLEGDIILKRKITLPELPERGDIIAFPNTAGYMMHFYETHSHLLELTTNLIADASGTRFVKDEVWQPGPAE